MLPTRRSQPYRSGTPRDPGLALQAMLQGAAQNMPNPIAPQNEQSALAGLLRQYAKRRSGPTASADVRGTFAQPAGSDLHTLLMQQLLRRRQVAGAQPAPRY